MVEMSKRSMKKLIQYPNYVSIAAEEEKAVDERWRMIFMGLKALGHDYYPTLSFCFALALAGRNARFLRHFDR